MSISVGSGVYVGVGVSKMIISCVSIGVGTESGVSISLVCDVLGCGDGVS